MQSKSTSVLQIASRLINHTGTNVFLTGKAGTGKTTFLKQIVEHTHKKCVVAAPTGIAAINAGGVTLHSLFQLPFGTFVPDNYKQQAALAYFKINDPQSLIKNLQLNANKRQLLREMELLIIDEVSMMRADVVDAIDVILKVVRKNPHRPFGGVQVLFIGDLLQLPPVVKDDEWQVLKQYYPSIFFFDAKVLRENKPVYIELEKIHRQSDAVFIQLLNNLRTSRVTKDDLDLLSSYYKPNFQPSPEENYITLTTHNAKAEKMNRSRLQDLSGTSFYYKAKLQGEFPENSYPVEQVLELKKGAQVIFVKNDNSGAQRFFNGKIGRVKSLNENEVWVEFSDSTKPILLETYEWENKKYVLNETSHELEESVIGTFTQYPVKLAWAITVHKSQGLSFDKAIVDIGDVFAPGQAYVALSRLRSLHGLVLNSPLNQRTIEPDAHVAEYSTTKSNSEDLTRYLEQGQLNYLSDLLQHTYNFAGLLQKFDEHKASYLSDKKKSVKQPHLIWVKELCISFAETKRNADRFLNQVSGIFSQHRLNHNLLHERVNAAKNYFLPILDTFCKQIFEKLKDIKSRKGVKTYLNELLELDGILYSQMRQIERSVFFVDAVLHDKEVDKLQLKYQMDAQSHRQKLQEVLMALDSETPDETKKKEPKKSRDKEPWLSVSEKKEKKKPSKEITYDLFLSGMSVLAIAKERGLSVGTIESQLTQYLATGQLESKSLINDEKLNLIVSAAKKVNSYKLSEIKSELGDRVSFSEIRFAIAAYLSGNGIYDA